MWAVTGWVIRYLAAHHLLLALAVGVAWLWLHSGWFTFAVIAAAVIVVGYLSANSSANGRYQASATAGGGRR